MKKQAGKVTYTGQALAFKEGKWGADNANKGSFNGVTELTADFDNKRLTGSINNWYNSQNQKLNPISIDAEIRVNTFQGTANKTGYVEGKFYGTNAENLAGAFTDKSQKVHGVFSGKK